MVFMGDKSTEDQQHRNCLKDTHAVNSQVLEEHSVCSNYLTFSSVFYASKTWKFETTTAPLSPFFFYFLRKGYNIRWKTMVCGGGRATISKQTAGLWPIHFICKHVRTQTDSEPRAAILLGILPITDF